VVRAVPDAEERSALVHRLGNLVLLSHRKDSAAQHHDFARKKARYFVTEGKVTTFALTMQVLSEAAWTPEVVRRRRDDLLCRLKMLRHL
jgi:hypothetical protein